jgi:hypothetical protein
MRNDFAVFILTHGRADNVSTVGMLKEFKYTGRLYLIIDDEDKQREAYEARYPRQVLAFSKADIASQFDEADNFNDRRTVFYARNACFDLARSVGLRYFMQLDDDYTGSYIRWNGEREGSFRAECLDAIFEAMIDYFASIPALSIAFSQGGDHIGGWSGMPKRKVMNSFLCSVDRPFPFVGRINDDVTTYTHLGRRGDLFLTLPIVQFNQPATISQAGGTTDLYKDTGGYIKSFYSVMLTPSAVKIALLRDNRANYKPRVHHAVDWDRCVAKIIPESFRKAGRVRKTNARAKTVTDPSQAHPRQPRSKADSRRAVAVEAPRVSRAAVDA